MAFCSYLMHFSKEPAPYSDFFPSPQRLKQALKCQDHAEIALKKSLPLHLFVYFVFGMSGLYGNSLGFVPHFDCFSVQNGLPFLPLAWVCVSKL